MPLDPALLDAEPHRPLTARVADAIRNNIISGEYPAGSILPSTRQIATELDTGLDTVTDSLKLLGAEGLVVGSQGKRYRVRQRPPVRQLSAARYARQIAALNAGTLPTASSFVNDYGIRWDEYSVDTEYVETVASGQLCAHTGWPEGYSVLRRRIVEKAAGVPVQIRLSILPLMEVKGTPLADPDAQPARGGILAELHMINMLPTRFREWWPARHPTATEARLLDIGPRVPVYEWMRCWYIGDHVIEISETVIPCDRLLLVMEGEL